MRPERELQQHAGLAHLRLQTGLTAASHCGPPWTGKIFCEYTSLEATMGPGYGQCQCYQDIPSVTNDQGVCLQP